MNWIGLAQDKGNGRALVNALMQFRIPKIAGYYQLMTQLLAVLVVLISL
jgi:hypothetical protein